MINQILDLANYVIHKAALDDMEDEVKTLTDRLEFLEERIAIEKPNLESLQLKVQHAFASEGVEEIEPKHELDALGLHLAKEAVLAFEGIRNEFNQKILEITESKDIDENGRGDIIVLLSDFSINHKLLFDADNDFFSFAYELEYWCKIAVEQMDMFERTLRLRYDLAVEKFFE